MSPLSAAWVSSASLEYVMRLSEFEYFCTTASTTGEGPVTPNGMSLGSRSCTALTRHTAKITTSTPTLMSASRDLLAIGHLPFPHFGNAYLVQHMPQNARVPRS